MIDVDRLLEHILAQVTLMNQPQLQSPEEQEKLFLKILNPIRINNWHKWFNTEKLEFILNPNLSPLNTQTYQHDHPKSISFRFDTAIQCIESTLSNWCNFSFENKLFIKLFLPESNPMSVHEPVGFAVIYISWETLNMGTVQLGFFRVKPDVKAVALVQLKDMLSQVFIVCGFLSTLTN